MTFVRGPLTILRNLAVDKAIPAAIEKLAKDKDKAKFAFAEYVKITDAARDGVEPLIKSTVGLANDAAQFFTNQLFDKYCQKFAGPFWATISLEFDDKGQTYWTYGVRLEGNLTLRYPKGADAKKPIRVTGMFEGNAVGFKFWEDVFVVEDVPKGALVALRQRFLPIPFINSAENDPGLGMFARALTPAYFNVPVEGDLSDKRLILKVQPAAIDFSPLVENRLMLIFINLVPIVKTFPFPLEKARSIIKKARGSEGLSGAAFQSGRKTR